jgi:15-cis-phytoene synthase
VYFWVILRVYCKTALVKQYNKSKMSAVEDAIFRGGSTTYYLGAKFFPKSVRADVARLYSFLRVADDYVDHVPPQAHHFRMLRSHWEHAIDDTHFDVAPAPDDTVDERVLKNIVDLTRAYAFDRLWVESFWNAMQADLDGATFATLEDSLVYVHGSGEIVGLMMAKIMGVSPEAYGAAKLQGRAMQWINFIRDIREDTQLGRCYFPKSDLKQCGLPDLQEATARDNPMAFKRLMRLELDRYHQWQIAAREGFRYLPRSLRPAIKTVADMYDWTAGQIANDPLIVFKRQVRPTKRHILLRGIRNLAD